MTRREAIWGPLRDGLVVVVLVGVILGLAAWGMAK